MRRSKVYSLLNHAVLNAIAHERTATKAVFGESKSIPNRDFPNQSIEYVVLTMNSGQELYVILDAITGQGIAQAAAAAAQIKYKCRFVDKIILIGIAAGQPNLIDQEKDVRLGDIVVSESVVQYDHIKLTDKSKEMRGDRLPKPDLNLIGVVEKLRSFQNFTQATDMPRPWMRYVNSGVEKVVNAHRPEASADPYDTKRKYKKGLEFARVPGEPYVHVGAIGSASTLLKNATFRDELNGKFRTIAYEMEGAGLAIAAGSCGMEYLMVRGICDYGDRNKNDAWQTYASVCAAAFARSVLEAM